MPLTIIFKSQMVKERLELLFTSTIVSILRTISQTIKEGKLMAHQNAGTLTEKKNHWRFI